MRPSSAANILVGISSDPSESRDLLSWAVTTLARPHDNIVALHVLVGGYVKKGQITRKCLPKIRRAKAYVISVLGEFAKTCQSHQINLEARVGFSTSVGRGLVKEAKSISAEYLLLRGSRGESARYSHGILRYCFENAPQDCAVVSVGKCTTKQQTYTSPPKQSKVKTHQLSSTWPNQTICNGIEQSHVKFTDLETKSTRFSPTTVLDDLEKDSWTTTDEYTSSFRDSIVAATPPRPQNVKAGSIRRKCASPCKFIYSLLISPFRKRNTKTESHQPPLRCFSHEKILNATNNFHPDNMVGQGGFSEVYRGNLSNGQVIAVKRLAKDNNDENKEREFLMELGTIGHVSHPNTASLVGYCVENGLYLVFNFSENGNLASALHGKATESLEWPIRYRIALGVARGLHYLHKCCKHRIIHRDIKASNILLGPDYEPQITDFGLAKWLPNKWTHHAVIPIEGTFGYIAPEYFMHGIVDEKTDVFAFGVLLLEIVTGRRPVNSSKQNILLWAMPLMEYGNIAELADPKMEGKYDSDQLHKVVLTASYCVRQSSLLRPTMSEVLELLTNGLDSDIAKSWRTPKFSSDEMDDYSMVFGYEVPTDISLEDSV
ncbi:probable receptor-like serine/threonine-protein kinase At5g57670 [Rhodamnia argentea]|uniref:Probable receptor-like serine/threonine-protein kinase At5g57670 n=1 Tax=Rhodamnia argentea TaxID=178133 RepID=A0A8B8NMC1_9MYRT|nr:probable receptor-like serine/threonine-protein kinase At5g57670 [Rhodamnia argentea]